MSGSRRKLSATRCASFFFATIALVFIVAVFTLFIWQSIPVWRHSGTGYFTGTKWFYRTQLFGALPMIYGSAIVSIIAIGLAAPVAIGAAIFTSEYLPRGLRTAVKIVIELLAAIPSVVYGLLGILFLREWVYRGFARFNLLSGDTLLTAGILLAVMVLPTVMTLSNDALRAVSGAQRAAARALGLTRTETILSVSLPGAAPGIAAALLLGIGRALGETIAVFLVIGRQDNQWPADLLSMRPWLEAGQTLTSKLGGSETNIAYGDPLHWAAMVGLGLILLATVSGITFVGTRLAQRNHA